jgi:hypothetical protein
MQQLGIKGYTQEQVKKALHSNRTIRWEYELLDKNDLKLGTIDEITGSYGLDSEAEIKGAASFQLSERNLKDIDFFSERIKPVFCLQIGSEWLKWEQGIYLLNSPNRAENKGNVYRNIEAYDKGVILREDKVDNRYLITKGTPYTVVVRELILSTGIQDISIQESELELSVDKEYEIGTSKLEIINSLLNAINYNSVWFNFHGTCMVTKYITGKERTYEYEYATDDQSITYYGSSETLDTFNIPNKFVRYVENPETGYLISTFLNEQASNKLSTISRGRIITDIKSITDIADQATLDDYTRKEAEQLSLVYGGYDFNTLPMPNHMFNDCLLFRNHNLEVTEKVIETSWSINASGNGNMVHKVKKVIELW